MKIALVIANAGRIGGAQIYVERIAALLSRRDHTLMLGFEQDAVIDRIEVPARVAVEGGDEERLLSSIRAFSPDVIFSHGLLSVKLETKLLAVAPAVYFAHDYNGLCISGSKTLRRPAPHVCPHKFGPACLIRYFPLGCGGSNPITMAKLFRLQQERRANFDRYTRIVSHSTYMRDLFVQNGLPENKIAIIPFLGPDSREGALDRRAQQATELERELRLLFVGRMDRLKGGDLLIDVAGEIGSSSPRRLTVTFVGDGPERTAWERRARATGGADFSFVGWQEGEAVQRYYERAHLLVVPSVWPEPFGLVGLEAAAAALPSVGFAVGGIPTWLADGENGALAAGGVAGQLADSIGRASRSRDEWLRLATGAVALLDRFSHERHVAALEKCLNEASHTGQHVNVVS